MSSGFCLAHASHARLDKLLATIADQLSPPFNQCLGFIYITDDLHDQFPPILNYLKDHTGIEHWVGTVGMGIIGGDKEYYDEPAIAVMLADIDDNEFALLPALNKTLLTFITDVEKWCKDKNVSAGILHGDPNNTAIQSLLSELTERTPATQYIGGLSSSRGLYPQVSDALTSGGLSGVLFSENVPVITSLSQGCTAITDAYTVTQSERNLLVTLNDEPALDIFKSAIGEVLSRNLKRAAGYIFAGIVNDHDNPDDYKVRNIIGADEEHKLLALGDLVDSEHPVLFCRRDGNTAQQDMQRMLDNMKQQLSSTPRGGVYISCMGRGKNQFGDNSEEVAMIKNTLGDFPLVGFYANGEIYHHDIYAFTGVLMLFI